MKPRMRDSVRPNTKSSATIAAEERRVDGEPARAQRLAEVEPRDQPELAQAPRCACGAGGASRASAGRIASGRRTGIFAHAVRSRIVRRAVSKSTSPGLRVARSLRSRRPSACAGRAGRSALPRVDPGARRPRVHHPELGRGAAGLPFASSHATAQPKSSKRCTWRGPEPQPRPRSGGSLIAMPQWSQASRPQHDRHRAAGRLRAARRRSQQQRSRSRTRACRARHDGRPRSRVSSSERRAQQSRVARERAEEAQPIGTGDRALEAEPVVRRPRRPQLRSAAAAASDARASSTRQRSSDVERGGAVDAIVEHDLARGRARSRATRAAATSSIRWLEISIVAASCRSASSSKNARRASGSRFAAGSSSTSSSQARPSATAISSFCFWPPDSFAKGCRQTRARVEAEALGRRPPSAPSSLPHTVAPRSRAARPTGIRSGGGSCGTKPTRRSTSRARWRAGRRPATATRPVVGVLAEQAADQRRLAGAVGADQRDALAGLDRRGRARPARARVRNDLRELLDPDHRHRLPTAAASRP